MAQHSRPSRYPRGMVTALALITMASMLAISLVAVDLLMKGLVSSGITGRSSIAYLAAESGAEYVLWLSQHDSSFQEDAFAACTNGWLELSYGATGCAAGGTPHEHLIDPGDSNYYYTVSYTTDTENGVSFHVFSVIGHYYDSRRSVEIRYVR